MNTLKQTLTPGSIDGRGPQLLAQQPRLLMGRGPPPPMRWAAGKPKPGLLLKAWDSSSESGPRTPGAPKTLCCHLLFLLPFSLTSRGSLCSFSPSFPLIPTVQPISVSPQRALADPMSLTGFFGSTGNSKNMPTKPWSSLLQTFSLVPYLLLFLLVVHFVVVSSEVFNFYKIQTNPPRPYPLRLQNLNFLLLHVQGPIFVLKLTTGSQQNIRSAH